MSELLYNKLDDGTYTMLLQGVIGEEFSGYDFANAIDRLNNIGAKEIEISINSVGGKLLHAYSIIGALLNSKAKITTINIGVAYSAAGLILLCGEKRKAYNYTSAMIHNAMGGSSDKIRDIGDNSVLTIISERTGIDSEEIQRQMNEETFYTGTEQLDNNFVDAMVSTNREAPQLENALELMNYFKNTINKSKSNKMDKVFAKLGVADENGVLLSIAEMENKHSLEIEATKSEKVELLNKIQELETKIAETTRSAVESMVNKAIADGKCAKESKDSMVEIGNTLGVDSLEKVFASVKTPHVDINNMIGGSGNKGENTANSKKWEDYSVEEKVQMKYKSPELYNSLLDDFQER